MRQAANGVTRAARRATVVLALVAATIAGGAGPAAGLHDVLDDGPVGPTPVPGPLDALLDLGPDDGAPVDPSGPAEAEDRLVLVDPVEPAAFVADATDPLLAAGSALIGSPDPCSAEPLAPGCDASPPPVWAAPIEVAGVAATAAAVGGTPAVAPIGPSPAAEAAPVRRAVLPAALARGSAFVGGWTGLMAGVALGFGACAALLWLRRRLGTATLP